MVPVMKALTRLAPLLFVSVAGGCSVGTPPVAGQPAPAAGSPDAPPVDSPASPGAEEPPVIAPQPGEPIPDPIVEQPAGAEERRILAAVAPRHLAELYRLVGRYARGDAPIYEGTFDARDNMGSLGATYEDGVIDEAQSTPRSRGKSRSTGTGSTSPDGRSSCVARRTGSSSRKSRRLLTRRRSASWCRTTRRAA